MDIRNLIFVERWQRRIQRFIPPLHYYWLRENSDKGIKPYRGRIKVSTTSENSLNVRQQSGNNEVIVPFHFHLDTISPIRREHRLNILPIISLTNCPHCGQTRSLKKSTTRVNPPKKRAHPRVNPTRQVTS